MKRLKACSVLSDIEKQILLRCGEAIRRLDSSAEVILYGSRARGDAGPESDYDLLILTDGKVTLEKEDEFRRQLFPIELDTGAVLTVFLISNRDWEFRLNTTLPLYENIRKDGVIL